MTFLEPAAFSIPYRDPVFDGATDPIVVEDPVGGGWLLFYTQRRATLELAGVEWVHGTRIGRARSIDGGLTWLYEGTVEGLEKNSFEGHLQTHWAPDIVRIADRWLLLLTVVDGVHIDWSGQARIEQFESVDLSTWTWTGTVPLDSTRVIDAAVALGPDGLRRLWYKDESRGSTTFVAVTATPEIAASWTEAGEAIPGRSHEGPKAFALGSWWWLVVDEWRGLAVHRSATGVDDWRRQDHDGGLILRDAEVVDGTAVVAHHADVVRLGDDPDGTERALIVYFTHYEGRRSHVHADVLVDDDGILRVAARS